ncbi:LysE family translocator [Ramlibacter sp. PS4R-6]|uniref:LysE family translocator n=1 Tax=Ramlibacter sp. PS4R-6 TaxID=3133438 RepID=UPI0030A27524
MPDAQHLLLFVAAGILLNLTPGPDVLYIVTNSLRSGAKAGVVAALGINAGCFVHIFAAAVGVSTLLAASATAFTVLKWIGAAYLVWIGVKLLVARAPQAREDLRAIAQSQPALPLSSVFFGGFLTNALNPKVAIFFLAFVPQFIAPDTEHKALAFVALGTLFNVNSVFVNAGWALAAAWMATRESVQAGMHWLDRAAGAMFVAFGLKLALSDNPNS